MAKIDDHYVYVFVRQDLSLAEQMVHSNHATFHVAALFGGDNGTPNLVVIGVPGPKALIRVLDKLRSNGIPRFEWVDPDCNLGVTAVATAPLSPEQKQVLSNYRLWRHSPDQSNRLVA